MNQVNGRTFFHLTICFNIILPFTINPRTGFFFSGFLPKSRMHISPSPILINFFSLKIKAVCEFKEQCNGG